MTTTAETTTGFTFSETLTIPAENVSGLKTRIGEVNKRAAKLGVEGVSLVVGATETKIRRINGIDVPLKYIEVTITGNTPRYEGWNFVASLEITEHGSLVRSLPGMDCPPEHRDRGNVCDHCKANRDRKDTYVVVHDDGRSMNVGRKCLQDFLGSGRLNPANIANHFTYINRLLERGGDDDWADMGWSGSKGSEGVYNLQFVLELTGATVSAFGWVSKSMITSGKSDGPATSQLVGMFIHHNPSKSSQHEQDMVAKIKDNWDATQGKRESDAAAALAWITSPDLPVNSDYIHSIQVLAKHGWTSSKNLGFTCSILTSWRMAMDREVERQEKAKANVDSQHMGEVKVRQGFEVKVSGIRELNGDFGITVLHLMEDRSGNRFKWFSSGAVLDQGETGEFIQIKATVKAHGEYNGIKETVITRVVEV
jgi:hypothetical protein